VTLGGAVATLILAASPFQQRLETAPKPRDAPPEHRFGEKCASGEEPPETVTPGPDHTPARQDPSHPFTRPEYPPGARIRGEEGTAVMLMLVNEKGRIVRARIDRSTGSKALDEAALKTSRDWQVIPATDAGKPVCGWARFAMTFRLEGGPPDLSAVKLLPGAERAFELMSSGQLLQWVVDLSGKPGARGAAPDLADEVMRANAKDFEQVKHDGEAMLSLAFTEDELQEIIRILESPVGMRFFRLQPNLVNQFYFTFNPVVRRAGCSVMLLKSSLDAGVAAKGIGGSGLPPAFRDAVPALVQESSEFCTCATRQPAWSETFRTGEDPLAFVRRACGKPPELKW
jgi:TonB family protein